MKNDSVPGLGHALWKLYDAACDVICVAVTMAFVVLLLPAAAMCMVLGRLLPKGKPPEADRYFRI